MIDLYWLPLGAGGHSVRLNGLVFEAIAARLQHRDRSDLYHSALEVRVPEGRFVIEQAPAWGESVSAASTSDRSSLRSEAERPAGGRGLSSRGATRQNAGRRNEGTPSGDRVRSLPVPANVA